MATMPHPAPPLEALPENPSLLARVRELFAYRELLWVWTDRELRIRYKQSVLGAAWAILQPLCLMAVLTAVFSYFAPVPTDGIPYPIFSYTGLLPWTFLASALTFSVPAMIGNVQLISKIYFPREILPMAGVIVAFVDLLIASAVFIGLYLFYGMTPSWNALWVAPLMALQTALILGLSLWTAAVVVRYRDLRFVVPLGIQLWMYASPVIYPMSAIPEKYRAIYAINPMAGLIEGYRGALLHGAAPDPTSLVPATAVSLALAASGYWFFKRSEAEFADVI